MRLLLILTFLFVASVLVADEPPLLKETPIPEATVPAVRDVSWRKHVVARDKNGNVHFEATEIVDLFKTGEEVIVLVWDQGSARGLKFSTVSDFPNNKVTKSVTEIDGGSFFRLEFDMPFSSKTRAGALHEGRKNMVALEVSDAPLIFVTNSVRRTILESAWRDEFAARAWRTEFRVSLSSSLLESIERLRNGLIQHYGALSNFHESLLNFIYWGGTEARSDIGLVDVVSAPPNCRFDAEMGHPCSDNQLRRIAKAAEAGKTLLTY